jgi:hypothetical protein
MAISRFQYDASFTTAATGLINALTIPGTVDGTSFDPAAFQAEVRILGWIVGSTTGVYGVKILVNWALISGAITYGSGVIGSVNPPAWDVISSGSNLIVRVSPTTAGSMKWCVNAVGSVFI